MYCSHVAYCTTLTCSNSHHQSSHEEILTFQLSPLVVSPEILVAKCGTMWARNGRWILPEMPDFHVAFRYLLHIVNLRHGTDGFTSPPKEGVLRIFSPWKIRRLRPGLNPRTWVPKASTLPLDHRSRLVNTYHNRIRKALKLSPCFRISDLEALQGPKCYVTSFLQKYAPGNPRLWSSTGEFNQWRTVNWQGTFGQVCLR